MFLWEGVNKRRKPERLYKYIATKMSYLLPELHINWVEVMPHINLMAHIGDSLWLIFPINIKSVSEKQILVWSRP